jgi:hypothetical protein
MGIVSFIYIRHLGGYLFSALDNSLQSCYDRLMKNECDGSGRHKLCSTREPHKHCVCGEPIGLTVGWCYYCHEESNRRSIHTQGGYIRESHDHTSDLAATRTDNIGYSPFKKSSEVFQFGNVDNISQRGIDSKSWKATKRSKGQLSEQVQDLLE